MNTKNEQLNELKRLYWANQERMMAFDQAGNAARDQRLKDFFYQQAEESERAVQLIGEIIAPHGDISSGKNYVLPAVKLFEKAVYQKPATFLITCARQLEMAMANLYHQIVTDLSSLPDTVLTLIKDQQEKIRQSKIQIAQL